MNTSTHTTKTPFNHKEATQRQDVRIEGTDLAAGKSVLELCNHNEQLTAPLFEGYNGQSGYCGVHVPAYLTIDLGREYNIGLVQFLLFDPIEDTNHGVGERGYSYRILAAGDFSSTLDKDEWAWRVVCDRGRDWCRNWQFIHIPEGVAKVRYIRIHCMDSRKNKGFHIVRLRVYDVETANAVDYEALIKSLRTEKVVPCPDQSYYPIADFCTDLGIATPECFIQSLDAHFVSGDQQRAAIRELHAKAGALLQTLSTAEIEKQLQKDKITAEPLLQPIDPNGQARYIQVVPREIQYEIGDGFPLSKRLHDTMNLARLMAKENRNDTSFEIEKRYLQGINSIISKKIDHDNNKTTSIDCDTIYQILDSIADDIELIEQDPKNTERIFLDPVNVQLETSNKQNIIMLILTILALIATCILPLLKH
jgi:hypothetical protein